MTSQKSKICRFLAKELGQILDSGKSVLLLGPRQTGKSTLIRDYPKSIYLNLSQASLRQRYELNPQLLSKEIEAMHPKPLVIIDEIQKVPDLLEECQELIDKDLGQFIFTGSSARKLKRNRSINLLPGRVIELRMTGLSFAEAKELHLSLDHWLFFGSLPEIALISDVKIKRKVLASYVSLYIEEEIRQEAVVKNLPAFQRFLELAAAESGKIVSFNALSKDIGVAQTTIASYYEILVSCLVAERIEPISTSSIRTRLTKSPKFIFFDLGVRRVASREGLHPNDLRKGELFEQLIGLELLKIKYQHGLSLAVKYWRDNDGPEVDFVLELAGAFLPIEVKLSDSPGPSEAKWVHLFLSEYHCPHGGMIVCTSPKPFKLTKEVKCIPWPTLEKEILHWASQVEPE